MDNGLNSLTWHPCSSSDLKGTPHLLLSWKNPLIRPCALQMDPSACPLCVSHCCHQLSDLFSLPCGNLCAPPTLPWLTYHLHGETSPGSLRSFILPCHLGQVTPASPTSTSALQRQYHNMVQNKIFISCHCFPIELHPSLNIGLWFCQGHFKTSFIFAEWYNYERLICFSLYFRIFQIFFAKKYRSYYLW